MPSGAKILRVLASLSKKALSEQMRAQQQVKKTQRLSWNTTLGDIELPWCDDSSLK